MKNDKVAISVRETDTHDSMFDAEIERIAALSTEEVKDHLCQMRLAPTQVLPERLRKLLAEARWERQMAQLGTYERLSLGTSAVLLLAVSATGALGSLIGPQVSGTESIKSHTPRFGEHIFMFLLKENEREAILGDLEEVYADIEVRYGVRRAKLWYYKQVAVSASAIIRKVFRVSLLAWVREWIRPSI
jgi:hypothetical protein